jgi:hypothetical protein
MDQQTLIAIASALFTAGVVYGMLNARVKTLEKKLEAHDDHADRLTRLETKLDILLEYLIKD